MPHAIIEIIAFPTKMLQFSLDLYFKKALQELESEWNVHKSLIEITAQKGGLYK